MIRTIHVLPPHVSNQIAAGEVVERPASVVKELVENAIDAGAKHISVEIENGGIDSIRIVDDGCGIAKEECAIAFVRHATSKISESEDLFRIHSLGFRGEALASIAAVSQVTMITRPAEQEAAFKLVIECGERKQNSSCAAPNGTSIEVRKLFQNVPARLKFLKSPRTEAGFVTDYVVRMMLSAPQVAFQYSNNGRMVYHSFGDGKLRSVMLSAYGASTLLFLREIQYDDGYVRFSGFVGTEEVAKPNRSYQTFVLNGRSISNSALSFALMRAFDTRLMTGRFPMAAIHIKIATSEIDVNVHPAKTEVRFTQEQRVANALVVACAKAIRIPASGDVADADAAEDSILAPQVIPGTTRSESPLAVLPSETAPSGDSSGSLLGGFQKEAVALSEGQHGTAITPNEQINIKSEALQLDPDAYKLLGVAFDTYILIEQGDSLLCIDQHAAHERQLFNRFLKNSTGFSSQPLLVPVFIRLSGSEYEACLNSQVMLREIGFDIHFMDSPSISLEATPQTASNVSAESFFREALQAMMSVGRASITDLKREMLIQTACKHAVKGGEHLSEPEIDSLLSYYAERGVPLTCPHGRPIIVRIAKREFEKLFKRVI